MIASMILVGVLLGEEAKQAERGDLSDRVRQLVGELDAPELARRDRAEEQLFNLGPQVLELLPRDAGPAKAERSQRLGRIRQKLQRAQAALGVQSSHVTLRGKMPLANVLASLEQQTGNKISTARLEGARDVLQRAFDTDFQQTPFWPALDQLLAKAGLAVYPFGEQGRIELVTAVGSAPPPSGHVSYAGPFRFEIVGLVAQRSLRPPPPGSLKLELEAAWEPRVAPISLKQRMADVQVIDDRGRPLAMDAPAGALEIPVPRGPIASRILLPMALPSREARTIAELRGTLTAMLPGPVQSFRFSALGRDPKVVKRIAGVSVTLEDVAKLGKSLEVRILVRFDQPGDALASHRTWIFRNPAYLETPDAKKILPDSTSPTRHSADEVGIALVFPIDRDADDYTLVYQTPTMIFTTPLEYRFREIPLP